MSEQDNIETPLIDIVIEALDQEQAHIIEATVSDLMPAEISNLIESLPEGQRTAIWDVTPDESRGEVLAHLHDVALEALAEEIDKDELISAVGTLESSDMADVMDVLSDDLSDAIRDSLGIEERQQLDETMAYPEGSAGRLMDIQAISVRADVSLDVVLRFLRVRGSLPDHTSGLMVIDRQGLFLGELPMNDLLTHPLETIVADIMNVAADRVSVTDDQHDVARLFTDHDLLSVAVINQAGKLVGRITVDDVIDVMREETDHQMMHAVGLDEEEDLFAPIIPSARRRALWLGINLATAFLASWVIGLFEETLDKVVALAVLMPIVASMGGITGSQTLTLAIRGMALGQITNANSRWLAYKETAISIINGVVWAIVVAVIAYLWFRDIRISGVLAAAMIVNMLAAAISGIGIPLILRKVGIDPALSGSVILTTVTDVVGFMSFLGLATIFLLP